MECLPTYPISTWCTCVSHSFKEDFIYEGNVKTSLAEAIYKFLQKLNTSLWSAEIKAPEVPFPLKEAAAEEYL